MLSGLHGKALQHDKVWPTKAEVLAVIPKHCFQRSTARSLAHLAKSLGLTAACAWAGTCIPATPMWAPAWLVYGAVTGTVASGLWVLAHECGHGAFSNNKTLQDAIGFVLHSALLVPYFSWQRSHAIHHAHVNDISEGETHVPFAVAPDPMRYNSAEAAGELSRRAWFFSWGAPGRAVFGAARAVIALTIGWRKYLATGYSAGPVRRGANHFAPRGGPKGRHALLPGRFVRKAYISNCGLAAVAAALVAWGATAGWQAPALLYGLPLLFVDAWLVLVTWLQHTDTDVPHFDSSSLTWAKGAFMTMDRPYGPICNFLQHGIGSTHVAHHVAHEIPHYHAWEATRALQAAFPDLYLYDPTPIHEALWRVATHCVVVRKQDDAHGSWVYDTKVAAPQPAESTV